LSAKAKLADLEAARRKLKVYGTGTSDVKKCVNNLAEAFDDYIRSDNLSSYSVIKENLLVAIEEHADLKTAVRYLNQAIAEAEEEVRQEEEAERQRQEELKKKLLGVT